MIRCESSTTDVIRPICDEDAFEFGSRRLTLLNRLKISVRNWRSTRPVIRVFFSNPKSRLKTAGPAEYYGPSFRMFPRRWR